MEVVASLSRGCTAAAQCGLFTYKSVPVIFEPPCSYVLQSTPYNWKLLDDDLTLNSIALNTLITHYYDSIIPEEKFKGLYIL